MFTELPLDVVREITSWLDCLSSNRLRCTCKLLESRIDIRCTTVRDTKDLLYRTVLCVEKELTRLWPSDFIVYIVGYIYVHIYKSEYKCFCLATGSTDAVGVDWKLLPIERKLPNEFTHTPESIYSVHEKVIAIDYLPMMNHFESRIDFTTDNKRIRFRYIVDEDWNDTIEWTVYPLRE